MHSDACAGVENMNRVSKKDLDVADGADDQALYFLKFVIFKAGS